MLITIKLNTADIDQHNESVIHTHIFNCKLTRNRSTIKIFFNAETGHICIKNMRGIIIKEHYIHPNCTFGHIRNPITWQKDHEIQITTHQGIFEIPVNDTGWSLSGEIQ